MYLDWVLPCLAILVIMLLLYAIYHLYPASEGFLVQVPNQVYEIPELQGVTGRYIRIRPSKTSGDGYLTISQIQVIDVNGKNVALKCPATATSQGGSPIDQKYGKQYLVGQVYQFGPGMSDGPLCVTDGTLYPRNGLTEVFETSEQNLCPMNPSAPDNQWLEIDLGANMIIKSVIYTGRGDAQNRVIQTIDAEFDSLTQVDRLNGIRLEIRNTANLLIFPMATDSGLFPTNKGTTVQTLTMPRSMYGVNLGLGSAADQKQNLQIPNIASYKDFAKNFDVGLFPSFGNQCMINTVYKSKYSSVVMDLSNNLFPYLLKDGPISFYNDIYLAAGCPTAAGCPGRPVTGCYAAASRDPVTYEQITPLIPKLEDLPRVPPALSPSISVDIFGSASQTAITEMNQSTLLCSKLYLGSPAAVENYVRVFYSSDPTQIKPYLRGTCSSNPVSTRLCVSDVIQVFQSNNFVTQNPPAHAAWNAANCTCSLTDTVGGSTILALLPAVARNFLVEWIANRSQRYQAYSVNNVFRAAVVEKGKICRSYVTIQRENDFKDDAAIDSFYKAISTYNFEQLMEGQTVSFAERNRNACNPFLSAYAVYSSAKKDMGNVPRLTIPTYVNITSAPLLNSIAQQFYELLGGQFAMTYIYDALPLGSTMIDIRFDLYIHDDFAISNGPLNQLKAQYNRIISATSQTQDVVDQATVDYRKALSNAQTTAIAARSNPFQGAVVRLFYTLSGKDITITGMIFDERAVSSFIPELNGGIPVPLGPSPGNVNFQPKIRFTKNQFEQLNCTDPTTLKRIMAEYAEIVSDPINKYPLSKAAQNPIDVTKGILTPVKVLGARQVSSTQCALTWTESLYDPQTNVAMSDGKVSVAATYVGLAEPGLQRLDPPTCPAGQNIVAQDGRLACYSCPTGYRYSNTGTGLYPPSSTAMCNPSVFIPVSALITRNGLFSYTADTANWNATHLTIDISGFMLYPDANVPQCKFDPQVYSNSRPGKFPATTSGSTIAADFLTNTFNNGNGPVCPNAIPKYVFNEADAGISLQQFISSGIYSGTVLRPATSITPLGTPVTMTKPLPYQTDIDTLSGICPKTNCQDIDTLYTIVDQYNSDPSTPGTILSVSHASTPNPYQCDLRVAINYDSMIDNILGKDVYDPITGLTSKVYPKIKKGTVKYSVGSGTTEMTEGSKAVPYSGVYSDAQIYTCPTGYTLSGTQCTPGTVPIINYGLATPPVEWNAPRGDPRSRYTCPRGGEAFPNQDGYTYDCLTCPTGWTPSWEHTVCNPFNLPPKPATLGPSTKPSITMAMYVAPDPYTCQIQLVDVSGQNSGTSLQDNTPALYTPMIYATELIKRSTGNVGSSVTSMLSAAAKTLGSAKPILKNYRVDTYSAAGAANILNSCNLPCSDSAVAQKMIAYYKTKTALTIDTILNTSSPDGQSCDATFTNTSKQTITAKFTFSPTCTVTAYSTDLIGPNSTVGSGPTDDEILDIRRELTTTLGSSSRSYKNPAVSAFTNYSPSYVVAPEALDVRAFGQDIGRNAPYKIREAQFQTPLVQKIPTVKRSAKPPSYRFLRFNPTQLRSAKADAVSVGKFIFFFDDSPLLIKGSASNPMGTWEGTVADVTGPGHRPGWSDTHKKPLVFAFRDPIAVDRYTWTTATPERGIEGDPISWKLEGSSNGTFWTVLDTQERFPTPVERFSDLPVFDLK
jgi:hypothetical protein